MPARWYQNSVIYALPVGRFQDSNGDGVGDLEGLRQRLSHIATLGADCVWLLPFYRSPMRDQGYDVSDHDSVDARYGTIGDFRQVVREADDLGLSVVVDFVINHTSVDHDWFRRAIHDSDSRFHDYYVWTDDPESAPQPEPVMPPVQKEVWTYHEGTGAWYLHHFFSHEADLDTANRDVVRELLRIVGFWLDEGVRGFRIDAVPYAVAKAGGIGADGNFDAAAGHWLLEEIRAFADARSPRSAFLFAEANVQPSDQARLFGEDSPQLHGIYNFTANQHLFLSLADGSAGPLRRALEAQPHPPPWSVYVNWLRNLDELDLTQLDEDERRRVLDRFAPDETSRLYEGILHRAAPMIDDDRMLRLAYSTVFALPGVPMVSYGEEIGMGDDASQPERQALRAPMQWTDAAHGGFCSDEVQPVQQLVSGSFGPAAVNAAAQQRDPDSLLRWMTRLVTARRQCAAIGAGDWRLLDTSGRDGLLALRYELDGAGVVVLNNLGDEAVTLDTDAVSGLSHAREVFSDQPYQSVTTARRSIDVDGRGYRWFTGETA